jgi:hypothetical protein
VANDGAGSAALVAALAGHAPRLIVWEARGGDETAVPAARAAVGVPVAAVTPRQGRDGARATLAVRREPALAAPLAWRTALPLAQAILREGVPWSPDRAQTP